MDEGSTIDRIAADIARPLDEALTVAQSRGFTSNEAMLIFRIFAEELGPCGYIWTTPEERKEAMGLLRHWPSVREDAGSA